MNTKDTKTLSEEVINDLKTRNDPQINSVIELVDRYKEEIAQLNEEFDRLAEEHSDLIIEKDNLFDIAAQLIRCKDCKHLTTRNSPTLYAYCEKTKLNFEPFGDIDTRTHFCSFGERKQ